MSRIISDLIRSQVAADAIDDAAADTLTWLIHDALPADAGLGAVDEAISRAREGFSPLFRKPTPKPQDEPIGPEPMHVRIAHAAGKVASTARTAADRVQAALAGGNPWATGNRTHQALVAGLDPDLAARLKRESHK